MSEHAGIVDAARSLVVIEQSRRRNPDGYGATAISLTDRGEAFDRLIREVYAAFVPGSEAVTVESIEERDRRKAEERERSQEGYETIRKMYREAGSPYGVGDAAMLRWAGETLKGWQRKAEARSHDIRIKSGL